MSLSQVSFAAVAQRLVCPPPPASANGSVPSLAAPAEPGVGVDTPSVYPPEIAVLLPEFRLPFSLLQTMGGWYLAIGCTRSSKYGRASIQQAGRV